MSDTSDVGVELPTREQEIVYIAFVQVGGIYNPDDERSHMPVETQVFWDHLDAVRWVREQVEAAHGELALVCESFLPITYYREGEMLRVRRMMWTILSPGGPTWGMVVDVNDISFAPPTVIS